MISARRLLRGANGATATNGATVANGALGARVCRRIFAVINAPYGEPSLAITFHHSGLNLAVAASRCRARAKTPARLKTIVGAICWRRL